MRAMSEVASVAPFPPLQYQIPDQLEVNKMMCETSFGEYFNVNPVISCPCTSNDFHTFRKLGYNLLVEPSQTLTMLKLRFRNCDHTIPSTRQHPPPGTILPLLESLNEPLPVMPVIHNHLKLRLKLPPMMVTMSNRHCPITNN